jgi:hypothetical protein
MASHFKNMVRSAFDFPMYEEVTLQRARRTVGYFTLVVVILSVVLTVANVVQLRSFVRKDVEPELDRLPVVTIKNHVASANVPQPWVKSFPDPSNGMTNVFIIDTTGQTTGFKVDEQGLILTRTQLLIKNIQNPNTPNVDLADIEDLTVDAKLVRHWCDVGVWIVGGSLLVLRPIGHAALKLLSALLLSLLGLIVASASRKRLRYGQIFTISIYALTPAIALDMVLDVLNVDIPFFFLIYFLVAGVYVGLAISRLTGMNAPPPPMPAGGSPGVIPPRNY